MLRSPDPSISIGMDRQNGPLAAYSSIAHVRTAFELYRRTIVEIRLCRGTPRRILRGGRIRADEDPDQRLVRIAPGRLTCTG
jgi:hypothetical protein